jgi:hypothetical protein
MKLIQCCIKSFHERGKLEINGADTGEPQPLVVKPVVNLDDPEFMRRIFLDQSAH